jgi:hypothetical protein
MADTSELIERHGLRFFEVHDLDTTTRVFACFCGPLPLGALTIDQAEGTVELVFVQDYARRLGLASALLQAARDHTGLPLDRDTGERSPSGHALAESLGLERGSRHKDLDEREAEAIGSRLMIGLYRELSVTELPAVALAH